MQKKTENPVIVRMRKKVTGYHKQTKCKNSKNSIPMENNEISKFLLKLPVMKIK